MECNYICKMFIKLSLFILIVTISPFTANAYCLKNEKQIPNAIIQYANSYHKNSEDYDIYYIMKWHKYDVFEVRKREYGIVFRTPRYVLFDGKFVLIPSIETHKTISWDVRIHTNKVLKKRNKMLIKKLSHNAEKIIETDEKTKPPNIPNALYKYAKKYMIKNEEPEFIYLMDWHGFYVYRTYWKSFGFPFHRLTTILYDGHTIRRPTTKEFELLEAPMRNAYENYLNEQARLHSKD